MNVFLTTIAYNFYFISIFAVLCSIISTFYYIRIIKILYFENFLTGKLYYPIKTIKTLILSILALIFLFLFIDSNFLNVIIFKTTFNVFPFFCNLNFTHF
jgi:NADH:ubiquinone oxidoreductase subunit 2 (subunit N)